MNVSIVKSLDARYVKKDGTSAIMLRIGRDNRTLPIPTKYGVPEKYWDDKKREVKKSYEGVSSVTKFNLAIDAELKAAKDVLLELDGNGTLESMSLMEIKNRILFHRKGNSFFAYADKVLKDLKTANRIGTHDAYQDAVKSLEKFHGSKNLDFKHISFEFLTKFETYHFANGFTANGLAAYMRGIRAIYNRAKKSGLVDPKFYPFDKYTIKTRPTEKRAIKIEFLDKIISLPILPGEPVFDARNYFVCSYMLYGMNYYDLAFLGHEHIIDGRIVYRRSKTSKLYDIKISPAIRSILDYYIKQKNPNEKIFPILRRDTAEGRARDIEWSRKRYNKKLKEIAKLCGIEKNLTSYVSRHSFATQALLQKVPLAAISAMLGHSSLKTTQIYLESLPSDTLDEYNFQILDRPQKMK